MGMRECRVRTCGLWAYEDNDYLCAWHQKVKDGLVDVDDSALRRELGITTRARTHAVAGQLRGIGPDAVLTDEELELLDLLRSTTEITRRGA